MSKFTKNSWVIFPLFSILSLSPAELEIKQAERQPASAIEKKEEGKHPLFNKLISKVDKSNPAKDITVDRFLQKTGLINDELKRERETFKKNAKDQGEVTKQRQGIETVVSDIIVLEEEVKILQQNKSLKPEDEAFALKNITDFKVLAEDLLVDLDVNEKLVAKTTSDEKKDEAPLAPVTVAKVEKNEEEKKDDPAVTAADKKAEKNKEEGSEVNKELSKEKIKLAGKEKVKKKKSKKENSEEKEEEEECVHTAENEKNKPLTKPAVALVQDQSLIMQQMMSMTQMMMTMLQQQQIWQMQQQLQNQGPVNQQVYQYADKNAGGSWVYYQNGFNPGMYPNQAAPQMEMQPQVPQYGPRPGYDGWGLAPQSYFGIDPRMNNLMSMQPGQFGPPPALGYNMQPMAQVPFGQNHNFPI